ncbi:tyrosine-type recombinase/integrase [Candidatus Woesearchaeota archaeon]|nr:tyrosine-type recombinase/integrase [Candidatus Woesearchaeota archaeon]
MKNGLDIHNYPQKLEQAVACVERAKISLQNKQAILKFRDFCSLEGIGLPRTVRYLSILSRWAEILGVDFDKATKEDIGRAVRVIQENEHYSAWTKATYKIMFKRFYRWLKDTPDGHPAEVKWIPTTIKRTEITLPSNGEMLTEADVQKLINAADQVRDKAFIATLYESGARIGEIATMQIKNLKFDTYGAVMHVTGKTGPRTIRIVTSTSYLSVWLQNHPDRNNNNAPLWVNVGKCSRYEILRYSAIRVLLGRLFKKAGVAKRFNPHIFRHSRATFLANHLTEFQMNQYFGWIQGSKMPATYVHMSGKSLDKSILALNGLQSPEKGREAQFKPKSCQRCDTLNSPDAKYCSKCAGVLDIQTAMELQEKLQKEKAMRQQSDNIMNTLLKDPEVLSVIATKINELNLK